MDEFHRIGQRFREARRVAEIAGEQGGIAGAGVHDAQQGAATAGLADVAGPAGGSLANRVTRRAGAGTLPHPAESAVDARRPAGELRWHQRDRRAHREHAVDIRSQSPHPEGGLQRRGSRGHRLEEQLVTRASPAPEQDLARPCSSANASATR